MLKSVSFFYISLVHTTFKMKVKTGGGPEQGEVLKLSFTNFLTGEQKCRKPANLSIVPGRFQRALDWRTKGTLTYIADMRS